MTDALQIAAQALEGFRLRLEAAEAERDQLREERRLALEEREELLTERARYRAALREYGDHTQTCDWRAPSAYPFACSCGWESTRRALTTSTQEER